MEKGDKSHITRMEKNKVKVNSSNFNCISVLKQRNSLNFFMNVALCILMNNQVANNRYLVYAQ